MSTFLIPLTNIPQSFEIALGGVNYTMTCRWNAALDAGWCFDLADADSGVLIVSNVPLITGADCLSGLEYLGIPGQMVVYTDGNELAVPTYENLGVESNLYFLTDDDV
jgi:hypothetical protein